MPSALVWLFAALVAACAGGSSSFARPSDGGRALFVAGLEGTGHNFWHDVFGRAAEQGWVRRMSHKLMKVEWKSSGEMMGPWGDMKLRSQPDVPLILNTLKPAQLQSYPACNNITRAQHAWPGLDQFAKTASAWGDRVDVLLMLRRADDVVLSAERRWKHPAWLEVLAAKELRRQLLSLPPDSKIVCLDLEDLPVVNTMLAAFLGNDGFTREAPNAFRGSMLHHCESDDCRSKELAEAMDGLRDFCSDRPVEASWGDISGAATDTADAIAEEREEDVYNSATGTTDAMPEEQVEAIPGAPAVEAEVAGALKSLSDHIAELRDFEDGASAQQSQPQAGRRLRKQRHQGRQRTMQQLQRQERMERHRRVEGKLLEIVKPKGHASFIEVRLAAQVQRGMRALDLVFGPEWLE